MGPVLQQRRVKEHILTKWIANVPPRPASLQRAWGGVTLAHRLMMIAVIFTFGETM